LYTFLADDDSAITVSETIELSGDLAADITLAAASARAAHEHVLSGR
jgi:hypothetical protein